MSDTKDWILDCLVAAARERDALKARVERLKGAGNRLADQVFGHLYEKDDHDSLERALNGWRAALKGGEPSRG